MPAHTLIQQALEEHQSSVSALGALVPRIAQLADRLGQCLASGGKIVLMGNGGSAADSQHIAAELVGRFQREREGLAALALTTDTSILTSIGNDYGFEQVFARQVGALCGSNDVLIGLSTSGNSTNVLHAIERGRQIGSYCVGLLGGNGGKLAQLCDYSLIVPSSNTPRVQEMHILIGHILCQLLES